MSKQKFYAIKNTQRVVTSWDECKAIVNGLSGAKYKSFKTRADADAWLHEQYLDDNDITPAFKLKETNEIEVVNYVSENSISGTITVAETVDPFELPLQGTVFSVDGSFNPETSVYGAGIVQYDNDFNIALKRRASGEKPEFAKSRNIAGETVALATAIHLATQQNLSEITVICDYEGDFRWLAPKSVVVNEVACWGNKKSTPIAEYHAKVMDYAKQNGIDKIHFVWVRGHQGIDSNELVDKLAKQACGLLPIED